MQVCIQVDHTLSKHASIFVRHVVGDFLSLVNLSRLVIRVESVIDTEGRRAIDLQSRFRHAFRLLKLLVSLRKTLKIGDLSCETGGKEVIFADTSRSILLIH